MALRYSSQLTWPVLLRKTFARICVAWVCLMAFYNPSGYSFSHWLWGTVGQPYSTGPFGEFLNRVTNGTPNGADFGILAGILAVVALLGFIILKTRRHRSLRAIFIIALLGGLWYLAFLNGITPLQTIVGLLLISALGYQFYTVERALGLLGTTVIVAVSVAVLWSLARTGWFDFNSGKLMGWISLVIMGLPLGIAASVGFWVRWWQGSTIVEDPDTAASHDDHHGHHDDAQAHGKHA